MRHSHSLFLLSLMPVRGMHNPLHFPESPIRSNEWLIQKNESAIRENESAIRFRLCKRLIVRIAEVGFGVVRYCGGRVFEKLFFFFVGQVVAGVFGGKWHLQILMPLKRCDVRH